MEAPKCKLCGDRHWGMCPSNGEAPWPKPTIEDYLQPVFGSMQKDAPRKGRPRIEDKGKSFEATKPWVALGMSRRTWYSRRKEEALRRDALKAHPLLMWDPRKEKEQGK